MIARLIILRNQANEERAEHMAEWFTTGPYVRSRSNLQREVTLQSLKLLRKGLPNWFAKYPEYFSMQFYFTLLHRLDLNAQSVYVPNLLSSTLTKLSRTEKLMKAPPWVNQQQTGNLAGWDELEQLFKTVWSTEHTESMHCNGVALFETHSKLNHSCQPNCTLKVLPTEPRACVRVRTLHPVKKGEELCISYIDPTWDVSQRQEVLRNRYMFQCDCPKCQEELLDRNCAAQAPSIGQPVKQ
eukprot:TRINITY_DN68162_c0_g1_i1.p1 TRINITY_DN68162_c0_g1~~TRINITY_DN68162_c0_g1_i1.p1  ORF type:complete len:241 (-),score=26.98 TRINITY_DN68162_c0_g1_i1:913-1635(-)